MALPKNYRLVARNNAGATVDVKVVWQPQTVEDNGSGRTQPHYGAESTVISNAALADGNDEPSSDVTNANYIGFSGLLIVTPAASANGRVELWMVTLDDALANPSTPEDSRHLRTLTWDNSSTAKTGSFLVQ